jgi:hypothetical protein
MKKPIAKWISIIFAVTSLGAFAAAQDNSTAEKPNDKPELRTVIGCLSETGNTYVVTGGAPGPRQFRIISGDTSMLKGKIGQTVRVAGMVGTSAPGEASAPPYNEGSTTGATYNTIQAQEITVKGGRCNNPGQEFPGVHP